MTPPPRLFKFYCNNDATYLYSSWKFPSGLVYVSLSGSRLMTLFCAAVCGPSSPLSLACTRPPPSFHFLPAPRIPRLLAQTLWLMYGSKRYSSHQKPSCWGFDQTRVVPLIWELGKKRMVVGGWGAVYHGPGTCNSGLWLNHLKRTLVWRIIGQMQVGECREVRQRSVLVWEVWVGTEQRRPIDPC